MTRGASVLVTGTSTGIGRAAALELARRGFSVYAGVRRSKDAENLLAAAEGKLSPVMLDVTRPEQIAEVARLIEAESGETGLHGLVNNAGINVSGPLEFLPPDDLRRQFEVNLFGQLAVTQALLPLLRKARGRVVNIGSVSGWSAMPLVGPYCASKFALRALNDSLRLELRPWGILVILVDPGPIATPIWDKAQDRREELGAETQASALYGPMIERALAFTAGTVAGAIEPERVAGTVIRALESRRPRARYLVGATLRSGPFVEKLPVRLRDWLIAKIILKDYK
ncbi:MAG TPA: SDR family oxidoreductase [bacterium]|nr:SDR family oxidoreductase [bacterium]